MSNAFNHTILKIYLIIRSASWGIKRSLKISGGNFINKSGIKINMAVIAD